MSIKLVQTTKKFDRSFSKLPVAIQRQTITRKGIFMVDPFSKTLRTHKLTGKLEGYWSFSIDYSHRIIFRFIPEDTVIFFDIGDHSIYK